MPSIVPAWLPECWSTATAAAATCRRTAGAQTPEGCRAGPDGQNRANCLAACAVPCPQRVLRERDRALASIHWLRRPQQAV